jgi:hypothetical protein
MVSKLFVSPLEAPLLNRIRAYLLQALFIALALSLPQPGLAQNPADVASVPTELQEWIPWVRHQHPDLDCAKVQSARECIWPGNLSLTANATGGSFTLSVRTDKEMTVDLPNAKSAWPSDVRLNGQVVPVHERTGMPQITVKAGSATVTGAYRWKEMPQTIQVPTNTGTLTLTVNGETVSNPKMAPDGSLRLGGGVQEVSEENRLSLDVSRKIDDGVPLVIHTQIAVRASGAAREVNLGQVLVPNTEPIELRAGIPARLDSENNLILRLRPGNHTVALTARYSGPATSITAPKLPEPWPEVEYWAIAPNDRVRAANFSGPPGIDPARTTLPSEWHSFTTYQVTPDQPLVIEELRRGEPNPAPNKLSLAREFWLDHDGEGWTVRDRFSGSMNQGWRLNVDAIADLGHVADHNVDQVITEQDSTGVELRKSNVQLLAESRIEGSIRNFAAVGWDADVHSLKATLHLPPGYSLLTATGVDNLDGSVLDRWNLWDLFFVLILALSIAKLVGMKWGFVALVGLALARHELDAPAWLWVLLVLLLALGRAIDKGLIADMIQLGRWATVALLLTVLAVFSVDQVQNGLFPQLDTSNAHYSPSYGMAYEDQNASVDTFMQQEMNPDAGEGARAKKEEGRIGRAIQSDSYMPSSLKELKKSKRYLSAQVDPNAVVQTGPGVPTWTWGYQPLTWSGPVDQNHQIRLFILSPLANLLLALLRVGLLLGLALRLAQLKSFALPKSILPAATTAALLVLLLPSAQAGTLSKGPSDSTQNALSQSGTSPPYLHHRLLEELDERLFGEELDGVYDTNTPSLRLSAKGDTLQITAEVHASDATAWAIPGPSSSWVPTTVVLDGQKTRDLARLGNGFLHVRLEPGIHQIQVSGPLGSTSSLPLQFSTLPKRLEWSGEGWELAGQKADGTIDGSVQLIRTTARPEGSADARSSEQLAPWLEVHRHLDLGIPWRVQTVITRKGPDTEPLTISVPLLSGEAVTSDGFEVEEGAIQITMERAANRVEWVSTLADTEVISLTAPTEVSWTERWTLLCSPIFACSTTDGPAPLHHVVAGEWSPEWLVWPGEGVQIAVSRPEAATGQTVTIDSAELDVRPGRRQQESKLKLRIRTSQGGQQQLTIPSGAELQSVTIGGTKMPLQVQDGKVRLPLKPGSQNIEVNWLEHQGTAMMQATPAVDLGGEAVNATVTVRMPSERWIAGLSGPSMGPVPLYWVFIVLVLIAAPLLNKLPWAPLKTWQWVLLGLGMTQVHIICPLIVIFWFMAMGHRETYRHPNWLFFSLWQLCLVTLTGATLLALYFSIHSGLLWTPDMQVSGNDSTDYNLIWYTDRIASAMPQATIISFPMWVWRVLMLSWSLWLAASLVKWLPWAWKCFSTNGIFEMNPTFSEHGVFGVRKKKNAQSGDAPATSDAETAKAEEGKDKADEEADKTEQDTDPT